MPSLSVNIRYLSKSETGLFKKYVTDFRIVAGSNVHDIGSFKSTCYKTEYR